MGPVIITMGIDVERLINDALASNAIHAAMVDVSMIQFHGVFRKACERNACGKYNTSWMGPPAIGEVNELMERAKKYRHGLLFQTVHSISSSFDLAGMSEGEKAHGKVLRRILERIKRKYDVKDILPLGAGCCHICQRCAYLDGESCRHPDEAVASVEAYGIDAARMVKDAGLRYHHGENTVSYIGLFLFNPQNCLKTS